MTIVKKFKGYDVPEGATHYEAAKGLYKDAFAKKEPSGGWLWYMAGMSDVWSYAGDPLHNFVELPQEPETFMPKVGEECEFKSSTKSESWWEGLYVGPARDGLHVVQETNGAGVYARKGFVFRPLKTEREKVIEWALTQDCHPCDGMLSRTDFCGVLFDQGALKIPDSDS